MGPETRPDIGPDSGLKSPVIPAQTLARRRALVRTFVWRCYGPLGTWRLHRAAFGLDLLRAPVNVVLAPVFLLVRLLAAGLRRLGARRLAAWLAARHILLETNVARAVRAEVTGLLSRLAADGVAPAAPPQVTAQAVADYAEVRNAVAEMTTMLIVLVTGLLLFHAATPGVLSLAGPVAEMRSRALLIEGFPLGRWAGGLWYGLFPVAVPPWQVALTGAVLAMGASVVTTFAGLIADPLQVLTGIHRRRLMRLLDRLDRAEAGGLAREHLAARMGDLSDIALSLWRSLRG